MWAAGVALAAGVEVHRGALEGDQAGDRWHLELLWELDVQQELLRPSAMGQDRRAAPQQLDGLRGPCCCYRCACCRIPDRWY